MKNLQELQDNQAKLLMYLAGELSPGEQVEVEQMLASDPSLRTELASLRQMQLQMIQGLEDLDRQIRPPVSEAFATAGISRMIQQWHEQRLRMRQTVVAPRRIMPRILLGMAAAASIVIGYLVWGVYHPAESGQAPPSMVAANDDQQKVILMENTMNIAEGLGDTDAQVAAAMPGPDDLDFSTDVSNQ
jgi:anti-sigma factor RsiW